MIEREDIMAPPKLERLHEVDLATPAYKSILDWNG